MVLRQPSGRVIVALGVSVIIFVIVLLQRDGITTSQRFSSRGRFTTLANSGDINNATFGFEKIFVVGLPSRTDRRDRMTLQAALSDIQIEFIDGLHGKDVPDNAIPKTSEHDRLGDANIGSWRAHMNAIQEVVKRNLSSALILEDDTDWDIRIREQLVRFAASSRALTQPLSFSRHAKLYADPTYPTPKDTANQMTEIFFPELPSTKTPTWSPYGDEWDLLWLGHCGMHFPFKDGDQIPKGRVIHLGDDTVAPRKNLWTLNIPFTLKEDYPEHTRAVHHVQEGVCSLGYAVTQKGARQVLHEVGLKDVNDPFDLLLRYYCEGTSDRAYHNCIATQPALFQHHRPAGPISSSSDIGDHGDGFRESSLTDMVRWSVRLNTEKILNGETDYTEQWPDEEEGESEGKQ